MQVAGFLETLDKISYQKSYHEIQEVCVKEAKTRYCQDFQEETEICGNMQDLGKSFKIFRTGNSLHEQETKKNTNDKLQPAETTIHYLTFTTSTCEDKIVIFTFFGVPPSLTELLLFSVYCNAIGSFK